MAGSRTLPLAITAKVGVTGAWRYVWLVDLGFKSGTQYFATASIDRTNQYVYNGHTYAARVLDLGSIDVPFIDRKNKDFSDVTIELDNLSSDGSYNFFYTAIDASEDWEDRPVTIRLYDVDAAVAVDGLWFGYMGQPEFSPDNKRVSVKCRVFFDNFQIPVPKQLLQERCQYAFPNETPDGLQSVGCPYTTFGTPGFTTCNKLFNDPGGCSARGMQRFFNGWTFIGFRASGDFKRGEIRKLTVPIVYGVGVSGTDTTFKINPLVYYTDTISGGVTSGISPIPQNVLVVNFIVSGVRYNDAGGALAFNAGDLTAANVRLFNNSPAKAINFKTGAYPQAVPNNATRFPDAAGHSLVAYCSAIFELTNEVKDAINDINETGVRIWLGNGRPVINTGAASENPVLCLHDLLTDPIHSIGIPTGDFSSLTAAANYVSSRYKVRIELDEQKPLIDIVQKFLWDFHGYITFNNAKIQIGSKQTGITAGVANFSTAKDGAYNAATAYSANASVIHAGKVWIALQATTGNTPAEGLFWTLARPIRGGNVKMSHKDSEELTNQVNVTYRQHNRKKHQFSYADKNAQLKAGNGAEKVVSEDFESIGLYDKTQVANCAAITIREEQNANYWYEFETAIIDAIDIAPGDVIRINDPEIINNGTNYLFWVYNQSFDTGSDTCTLKGQIYLSVVYADTSDPIGIDVLRSDPPNPLQGKPPDVTPSTLTRIDTTGGDSGGQLTSLRATWAYPSVDLATEQAAGEFREYPIQRVELWWRYSDESVNELRLGKSINYPTTQGDFQVDYDPARTVECWFVAVGPNGGRASFGYMPNAAKATTLSAALTSTATSAGVVDSANFATNDYVFLDQEIAKLSGTGVGLLNFVNTGVRTAQFGTTAAAHAQHTEIYVGKTSYPTLTLTLSSPTFTYAAVGGLSAESRGDGVRFRWTDPDKTNLEDFLLYVSLSDPGSGSTTPAWYTTNPESPPGGTTLVRVSDLSYLMTQERVVTLGGSATSFVFARVAARNPKGNFSSALSALASAAGSATGIAPTTVPSSPSTSGTYLIENSINTDTAAVRAKVTVRIFADAANTSTVTGATWQSVGAVDVTAVFRKTGDSTAEPIKLGGVIADRTQTYVDLTGFFQLGQSFDWLKNITSNGAGKINSTGGSVAIVAGLKNQAAAGIPELTTFSLSVVKGDGKQITATASFTQPASPVLLKELWLERSTDGGATYKTVEKRNLLSDAAMQTSGAKEVVFDRREKQNTAYTYRITMVAIGDATRTITAGLSTDPDVTAVAPGAGGLISISSSIDDLDGTKGVKASAAITISLPGLNETSADVVLTDNTNSKKHRRTIELLGSETSAVLYFDQFAKVGHSITVSRIRVWNQGAFTDTNNPAGGTFTAGGTINRPSAPSLSVVKRFTNKTKYTATLGIADTNIRQLQVWSKANPAGVAPTDNDPNPAGWTAEEPKNIHGPAKAGALSFNFTINHKQDERLDVVARFVNSNGDLGTWSAVLDAGAIPETDAAAPTAVTITSATSDADPLPNNTGRQFIVSVGVSWSGPANQVDGKITVNSKDHVEHVPVDTITGSTGNTATIVFSKMFKQGQSGTIQVRVRNANAKSAWVAYASNPLVIGGSGGTLASPSITQFERNPYNAIYAVTWTANADLAYLHVQKQKTDLSWVDQPKVDITSVATVGAVHISIEVKGALANTTVFPNVRVRLQDTSGNLSAWVQLNGASQPSGTEFYMDNPTGWFDSGKLGLIGTGASANLNTVVSQRNDGNKTLVPNLTDAVWPAPLASQAAAIDTVTGHFKNNIPNGQVVTYMEAGNMRIAIFNANDGLWYRFNAATSIGGGTSGTPSDPPPGDGGVCFSLDSFVLSADGSPRTLGDMQIDDEILGIDMKTGQEIIQRVMGIIHHDPAEFIIWNFLRMAEHLLCRWCPNPYKPEQIKPPGLSDWLQPRSMHLGQQFWSRDISGVIGPFTHSSTSAGSGMIVLASLMTSGKTYWIGDGQQFVLAHNAKVLT